MVTQGAHLHRIVVHGVGHHPTLRGRADRA
jgi:hypothetical protein